MCLSLKAIHTLSQLDPSILLIILQYLEQYYTLLYCFVWSNTIPLLFGKIETNSSYSEMENDRIWAVLQYPRSKMCWPPGRGRTRDWKVAISFHLSALLLLHINFILTMLSRQIFLCTPVQLVVNRFAHYMPAWQQLSDKPKLSPESYNFNSEFFKKRLSSGQHKSWTRILDQSTMSKGLDIVVQMDVPRGSLPLHGNDMYYTSIKSWEHSYGW